ncbi:hypothetical protein [Amycolatopsis sp. TNS106]|uniref:hypothetical protein n=1 Tax=Amycolatopsis sp. TNS106 TaxID=2861750 RepID=UPI001C59014C|nr:hypothetical protein [Amycolatopsis sp. TNS106]
MALPPRQRLLDNATNLTVPTGHLAVDNWLARAQFLFWSYNIWDIAQSVLTNDPEALPDRSQLDDRARAAGARPGMSSFSEVELTSLAAAFESYRSTRPESLTAQVVVSERFLPHLLYVELGFQGHGDPYPARPRTDGGDEHESRLLRHCLTAHRHFSDATPSTTDQIYRQVCRRLDGLLLPPADRRNAATYTKLIESYNVRHPMATVTRLHVPERAFPPGRTQPAEPSSR